MSTGDNLPCTAEQIKQGLSGMTIGKLAAQTAISEEQFSTHPSTIILQVVDKLTPDAQIAQADVMSKGMDLLQGLLR